MLKLLRSGEKGPYCKYGEDQRYLPIPALSWELCQRVSCGVNKAFVAVVPPSTGDSHGQEMLIYLVYLCN